MLLFRNSVLLQILRKLKIEEIENYRSEAPTEDSVGGSTTLPRNAAKAALAWFCGCLLCSDFLSRGTGMQELLCTLQFLETCC